MFLQFNPLVVVFSTINCIKNVKYIHIDGTYKLNDYNFPIIVLGFSDFEKSFFLTALSIVETESEDFYFKVSASIKNKCRDYNVILKPRVFIADNSSFISIAIIKCFPQAKRTDCWAHIVRLITPKLTDTKEFKKLIINDIYLI